MNLAIHGINEIYSRNAVADDQLRNDSGCD